MARAIASDLTYLRGMEQLTGRETLAALALELAHALDDALAARSSTVAARYSRELRAAMAALGRPEDTTDDRAWLDKLSAAVGDTTQP